MLKTSHLNIFRRSALRHSCVPFIKQNFWLYTWHQSFLTEIRNIGQYISFRLSVVKWINHGVLPPLYFIFWGKASVQGISTANLLRLRWL